VGDQIQVSGRGKGELSDRLRGKSPDGPNHGPRSMTGKGGRGMRSEKKRAGWGQKLKGVRRVKV